VAVPGGQSLTHIIDEKNIGFKISAATAILVSIGLVRCVWASLWGISLDAKWYSFDPDVLFVMACFPVYLCFFTFLCMHLILKGFGFKNTGKPLIIFLFFIQLTHLIIPPVDRVALSMAIPWSFHPHLNAQIMTAGFSLNPFDGMPSIFYFPVYFTPLLMFFTRVTTLGINVAWVVICGASLLFLLRTLKIPFWKSVLILCIAFQVTYWPVYKYYFIFDGIFNAIMGMPAPNHFGYGFYFLAGGIAGIVYLLSALKKPDF